MAHNLGDIMFDLFKNYIPVVQDLERIKEEPIKRTSFIDKWGNSYYEPSIEVYTKRFFYFMHKDTARRVDVIKKPLPKEWNRYKDILAEIRRNTHITIMDQIKNLPKLAEGAKVKIPKDFYKIKDIVEKDMKERLGASNNQIILQFNLRASIFEDKHGDLDYVRGIEVCPVPDEFNDDVGRNYKPISWTRVFLYEYPTFFLRKLYCGLMNLKNRKQIKKEYQEAKKLRYQYIADLAKMHKMKEEM